MSGISFKKLPLSLKISVLTFLTLICISVFANLFFKGKTIQQNMEFFIASAEQCLDSIQNELASGDLAGACEIMQKASKRNLTSFFIIQAGGVPVCYAPADQLNALNLHFENFNTIVHDAHGNYDFKSIKAGNFVATAGWLNNSDANFLSYFILKLPTLLFGILISVLSIAYISFRETRPIKKLLAVFKKSGRVAEHLNPYSQNQNRTQTHALLAPAAEIQQLWQSAAAYEQATDQLKDEVRFVAQDAQNFLRKEIKLKNDKIPYRFFSTMLRFDMNNYTKTFLEDPEATQDVITELSLLADELVHRYGGLHYAFGGDEFIVMFQDSEFLESGALHSGTIHSNAPHSHILDSRKLAFACIRDIFLKLENDFQHLLFGKRVTLKASISRSENVLFALPNGLCFRGLNLILSQRYLTTIAVKDANKVVISQQDLGALNELAEFQAAQTVTLKGLPGAHEINEPIGFFGLDEVLRKKDFCRLPYFRSDLNLSRLLTCLREKDFSLTDKMAILDHLKSFEISRTDSLIATDFLNCFLSLDADTESNKKILSSLFVAAEKFIPGKNWNDELTQNLLEAKCKSDSRCHSTILSLLASKLPSEKFNEISRQFLASDPRQSFRSRGDFLIAKAKTGLTDKIFQECHRMLKSKNELEVATGIFVTSRIIQTHKLIDPIALSQFDIVPLLITRIAKLQNHEHAMVKSRARFELGELNRTEIKKGA